jgi:hypothetical protein
VNYQGVDFFQENHQTFSLHDGDRSSEEVLAKISPHIRLYEGFELKLLEMSRTAKSLVMNATLWPLTLKVKVYHKKKLSYDVIITANVSYYELGYRGNSDQYPIRIVFHCLDIECND